MNQVLINPSHLVSFNAQKKCTDSYFPVIANVEYLVFGQWAVITLFRKYTDKYTVSGCWLLPCYLQQLLKVSVEMTAFCDVPKCIHKKTLHIFLLH